MMADVTLEFLGTQLERLLREFADMRAEMANMRTAQSDLADGQTVLTQTMFRVERDIVQVKDILARIDGRVRRLEETG